MSYIELNDLGSFASIEDVWAAYPEGGQEGDYCTIDGTKYHWNKYTRMWGDTEPTPTPSRPVTTFDGDVNIQNDLTVAGYIRAKGIKQPCLGLFLSEDSLTAKWPEPEVGMWALVGDRFPATVYVCETEGEWTETQATGGPDDVDLTNYVTVSEHESDIAALVPKSDIADNLNTNNAAKVLSARQGYLLNQRLEREKTYYSNDLTIGSYDLSAGVGNKISGTVLSHMTTFGCIRVPVKQGDTIIVSTLGGTGARAYAVTTSDLTLVDVSASSVDTTSDPVTLSIGQDGYVFINCKEEAFDDFSVVYKFSRLYGIEEDIDALDDRVTDIEETLTTEHEHVSGDLAAGAYELAVSVGSVISTRIYPSESGCMLLPVSKGDIVTISTKGTGVRAYALASSDYKAVVVAPSNTDTTSSPVTLTVGQDGYLFVNCKEEAFDDFSVVHKYSKVKEIEEKIDAAPEEAAEVVYNTLREGNGKSENYAIYNGHNCYVPDLWIYNEGHSAATDIQNNVLTTSTGVFTDPIITKIARFSDMVNRRWRQYFNKEEGVGSGSVIAELLSLQQQDSGNMLPLQMRATFYNPSEIPIKVTLAIVLYLDRAYSGSNRYVVPKSSKVTVPAGGSATAHFSFTFPEAEEGEYQFTWANVTGIAGYSSTDAITGVLDSNPIWLEMGDVDLWFDDPKHRVNRPFIKPSLIESGITESQLTAALQEKINSTENNTIDRNLRVCCAGSSVTWGEGFLQSSMMKYLIPMLQSQCASVIPYNRPTISGPSSTLSGDSWRQLYGGYATKLSGADSFLEFDIEGDELTICQAIERSNANASIIEVYIDGSLYGSFSNYNPDPIGSTTKTFTATEGQSEFVLDMPFTYNHVVTVNGVAVTANLNMQDSGGTIPTGHWGMICREVRDVDGVTKVVHTLFASEGQTAGTEISVSFDYGHEILYEKTTIGKDGNGALESAYGKGNTAFDPANPQDGTFESGLDFRCTDERAMVRYRFHESALRHVKLVVKELDSRASNPSGVPYFIFNFATNRIMWFQNAGIGGWRSSYFISENNYQKLKTWKEIADFQPDFVMYESSPNDDVSTGGYKLHSIYDDLTLSQLRGLRTLPNKEISYDGYDDVYCYKRYAGLITAITKNTVTFAVDSTHVIDTAPAVGDVVQVGTYHSNNKEVVARMIAAYDNATHTITFDRPICERDYIYESLDDFVGLEVQVRNLGTYGADTTTLCNNLKAHCDDVKIGLVGNPAANLHCRNIEIFKPYLDYLAGKTADFYVDLSNVYDWQTSIPRDKLVTVSASSLETDSLTGYKTVVLDSITALADSHNWEVLVNGVNVYGKDAFVDTLGYSVSKNASGSSLESTHVSGGGSVNNLKPKLIFVANAPDSGTIDVKYSSINWSGDSTHLKNDYGRELYAIGYKAAIMENFAGSDNKESQGGGSGEQVQADWNQNSSSAVDFIKNKPTLAAVATSGSYNDLSNKPTIPDAQIQADWNQTTTTAKDYIKNKPTIPAAQVQSNWNESDTSSKAFIQNKPTIPTVPTNVSAFANDAGYLNNNFCPIIEDTRSSAVAAITGVAPFSTLVDGQRIMLKVAQNIPNSPTLTLTLSDNTTEGPYSMYTNYQSTALSAAWNNNIRAGSYIEMVYESTNTRWIMVGQKDTNTTYGEMTQAQISAGTNTALKVVTPKLFHDNAYIVEESYSSGSLKANKFYDFGTVSSAITIPEPLTTNLVSNALNFYALRFIAGADNISITFPTGVIVDDEPTINTGDYVEIMINKYGNNYYASIKVWQAQ